MVTECLVTRQEEKTMADFRAALTSGRVLLFDGGMGTQLQARGLPPGEDPQRFCLARPEVLRGIHADYLAAGADIVLTATFGGTRFKLPEGLNGPGGAADFNRTMARVAREAVNAAGRPAFVGGDMGPCGRFVKPLGELDPQELYEAFREQVRGLAEGGADLIVIETQFDLAEARLAVAAVRAECDLPVAVSMTFEDGASLTGTTPEIFAATMRNMGVDVLGLNCGAGPEQMAPLVDRFLACTDTPVMVEPNAGLPELVNGETVFRLRPGPFAEQTARFVERGVGLVGGCCGTTPEHIAALRRAVDGLDAPRPRRAGPCGIALTTRSSLVRIGADQPLRMIGERINPTGKKALQSSLLSGDFSLVLRFADEQIALGAPVLDVNVGAPLVDETAVLPEAVLRLTARVSQPLSLDSSNAEAVAAALPLCPGSCLVNSISGEPGRLDVLGPLCRQWGAPFVLLPLQGRNLPVLAKERIAIIEDLLERAQAMGLPRHLVLVDVLALSVASKAEAGREALETLRWCAAHDLPTVVGLSNISFGLPARELVNATFLSMAMGAGLNACIANPSAVRVREAAAAADVLLGHDEGAQRFVEAYSDWKPGSGSPQSGSAETSEGRGKGRAAGSGEAVLLGDRENITALVEAELAAGADPFGLVRDTLIPAITEVGARYERREYFLPQLLRSAEAMQTAMARLEPLLAVRNQAEQRPVAVLATVEGDIHDIGKNIVGLLMSNHGFEVVDLGKDVKAEAIVAAAARHKASIIGLSALMTTTMVRMEDTVRLVRERNMDVRVMVGGAVVTEAFARSIGADGYSEDAVEAVRLAKRLLSEGRPACN